MSRCFDDGVQVIPLTGVKAFLLACNDSLVLVDTGRSEEDVNIILRCIKKLNKSPKDIELCVITHQHRDHIGGLSKLKEECDFKVASHKEESKAIEERTGIAVDLELEDGQVLPYCGGTVIVHVPGHTAGNICLYLKEKGAIIAGDTLFMLEGKLSPPPDQYCKDPEMARRELRRLLDLDFDSILVSHGEDLWSKGKAELRKLMERLGY